MIGCANRWSVLIAPNETASASGHGIARLLKSAAGPEENDARSSQLARVLTQGSRQRLVSLSQLDENWDGNGSAKPKLDALANAGARLSELYRASSDAGVWREPHISASEDGEVTFEWWSNDRKVTMYFGEGDSVEVIRVWGADIEQEMDLQSVPTLEGFPGVWSWLYGA